MNYKQLAREVNTGGYSKKLKSLIGAHEVPSIDQQLNRVVGGEFTKQDLDFICANSMDGETVYILKHALEGMGKADSLAVLHCIQLLKDRHPEEVKKAVSSLVYMMGSDEAVGNCPKSNVYDLYLSVGLKATERMLLLLLYKCEPNDVDTLWIAIKLIQSNEGLAKLFCDQLYRMGDEAMNNIASSLLYWQTCIPNGYSRLAENMLSSYSKRVALGQSSHLKFHIVCDLISSIDDPSPQLAQAFLTTYKSSFPELGTCKVIRWLGRTGQSEALMELAGSHFGNMSETTQLQLVRSIQSILSR